MEQRRRIHLPQPLTAAMLAPQPPAQSVPCPVVQPTEAPAAVLVVEVTTPAVQHPVQLADDLCDGPMLGPVIESLADLLAQPLSAFGARLDVRIPPPCSAGWLPAH